MQNQSEKNEDDDDNEAADDNDAKEEVEENNSSTGSSVNMLFCMNVAIQSERFIFTNELHAVILSEARRLTCWRADR